MKKILFLLIFCFLSILPANAEYFYIKNYGVRINVNENKVFNISEFIDVYFTQDRHGIFRIIPLVNYITRNDGSSEVIKSKISNINSNDRYSLDIYTKDGVKTQEIKIGSPDITIRGDKSYIIKYDYSMTKPKTLKDKDEFYFNIIGTDWDVEIQKVNFEIIMPKNFEKDKVGFSIGLKGTAGYDKKDLVYRIEGNTIKGSIKRPLKNHESLTIRLELPKDYFTYTSSYSSGDKILVFFVIALTIAAFITWFLIGKDEQIIPVVNFKPPNLNSAVTGSFYREGANDKDIVSLIFYLASKGYITIDSQLNDYKIPQFVMDMLNNALGSYVFEHKNYFLIKNKDYAGSDTFEASLMRILFEDANVVGLSQLAQSEEFYTFCEKFKSDLNKNCKKLYYSDSIGCSAKFIPLLATILSLYCLAYSMFDDYNFFMILNFFVLLVVVFVAILIFIFNVKKSPVFAFIWACFFGGMPIYYLGVQINGYNFDKFTLIALACLVVSTICLKEMPRKTNAARALLGKIAGFKKFLEVVEKHRIEMLVKDNPSYCFDVLPYAYVLGVSDEFIKKFEKYFNSKYWKAESNAYCLSEFFKSCHASTRPSVANGGISRSSSGGSGGGGHSGGGGGGGGGGSW